MTTKKPTRRRTGVKPEPVMLWNGTELLTDAAYTFDADEANLIHEAVTEYLRQFQERPWVATDREARAFRYECARILSKIDGRLRPVQLTDASWDLKK